MSIHKPLDPIELDMSLIFRRLRQDLPPPAFKSRPVPVAVAGATGLVGQKLLALIDKDWPHLTVVELAGSAQRAGQSFGESCHWQEPLAPMPCALADMTLLAPDRLTAPYILSCLPAQPALWLEPLWTSQGQHVFSNASAFRMQDDVPLLVPEVNPSHLALLELQSQKHGPHQGHLITNPNCVVAGLAPALAPLCGLGAIQHISIVTLQATSGAGYPGLPSLDILANTIPHIPGEAPKIACELAKVLGTPDVPMAWPIAVSVHRVPVRHGHSASVHVVWNQPVDLDRVKQAYAEFSLRWPDLFAWHHEPDRPQAVLDLTHDDMRIHIKALSLGDQANVLILQLLSHNLVRGAAGALLANLDAYLTGF
jgi:aspartate-semialdehyde dehydrogenase